MTDRLSGVEVVRIEAYLGVVDSGTVDTNVLVEALWNPKLIRALEASTELP